MAGRGSLITVDPSTGLDLESYDAFTREQIDQVVSDVAAAGLGWSQTSLDDRATALRAVAEQLRTHQRALAELMVAEMGKPIAEAMAEVLKCAWACDYYADNGPRFLSAEPVLTEAKRSWIAYEPIGVVLAIMPWNFPYWQVFRFAAPTLMAGNTALLKHSPNVTGSAIVIEKLFRDAGFPANVFRTLLIAEADVPAVTGALIADDRVAGVTVTGSERAGVAVASAAGAAVKKSVMELGGSDPFVVLADADLELAVASAVRSRFVNSGQSCLAAKRFIVHRDVAEEFTTRFARAVSELEVGDPREVTSAVGPLARADLVDELERQVTESVLMGAVVAAGGMRIDKPGNWFAPTVLSDVTLAMPAMAEETFGPVAAVMIADDDDDAIRLANASRYGLGASVWSTDEAHALAVGARVTSGALFINSVVVSDPRLPFGGTKRSGYGRELGAAGALEFTNIRTVVIGTGILPTGVATE